MHFSQSNDDNGSKMTKIAIVTALHVAVGMALVNNMGHHNITRLIEDKLDVVFIPKTIVEPPPPPAPPEPTTKKTVTEIKKVVTVPLPEVPVTRNDAPTITAEAVADPLPTVPTVPPAEVSPPAVAKVASDGTALHTAVLSEGCAKPDYPARAAREGISGTVNLALLVGVDGRVADARIEKSSGSRELDRAAVSALSMCKFKAATKGGVPEQGWSQIAYVWTLEQ